MENWRVAMLVVCLAYWAWYLRWLWRREMAKDRYPTSWVWRAYQREKAEREKPSK